MKLTIHKPEFIKLWNMAEYVAGTPSSLSSAGGILCTPKEQGFLLHATDLKTSFTCETRGVTLDSVSEISQDNSVVFPIKVVGELFKRAPSETFTVDIHNHQAVMRAQNNVYRFTTYPVEDFPRIPSEEGASFLCSLSASNLLRLIEEGSFAGSSGDEYPPYISGVSFRIRNTILALASTDIRRITLSRTSVEESSGEDVDIVLPVKGMRELQKVLGMLEDPQSEVRFFLHETQVFCKMESITFSLLRMDVRFPSYENLLERARTTWMVVDRTTLLKAIERLDILVRDGTRMIIFQFSPAGECTVAAFSQNVGAAVERLSGEIDGEPLQLAFNSRFILDGLKALHGDKVEFALNKSTGQLTMFHPEDEEYRYVVMPVNLQEQEHENYRRKMAAIDSENGSILEDNENFNNNSSHSDNLQV